MLKTVSTAGFALFSMYFGSGNIVFPINLGRSALDAYPYVILGLFLTAVLVPVLGFLSMLFSDGSLEKYFGYLGKVGAFVLCFLMLSLMGPFGIIPRCITVSFGGVQCVYPNMELWQFSFIFSAFIAALVWKPNKIVSIIGNILTPFKLGGIVFLIVVGLWYAPSIQQASVPALENFVEGITTGYQTMDLLASFFFAVTVVEFIRQKIPDRKELFKASCYAGGIGAIILIAVYSGFVVLGAAYGPQIMQFPAESLLARISGLVLGDDAIYIVSFTIAISCLATATILTKLFVDFIQVRVFNNAIGYHTCVGITLLISFIGALLGFKTIVTFIHIMLSWMYPLLIGYALFKLYEGLSIWKKGCSSCSYNKD